MVFRPKRLSELRRASRAGARPVLGPDAGRLIVDLGDHGGGPESESDRWSQEWEEISQKNLTG